GSLEGLPVTFAVTGAVNTSTVASTNYNGIAVASIDPLTAAGSVNVVASVVNPTSGATLTSASASAAIVAGAGDHEPNGTIATASAVRLDRNAPGTLDAGDRSDVYRPTLAAPGELTATLTLAPDAPFDAVVVRFLAADGTELQRAAATASTTR